MSMIVTMNTVRTVIYIKQNKKGYVMTVKYKTREWGVNRIKKIEIERETESSVWIRGQCCRKKGAVFIIADSFEEAKEWLVKRAERVVERMRGSSEFYAKQLEMLKGLKEEGE